MAGMLSRLKKKASKTNTMAASLLVQGGAGSNLISQSSDSSDTKSVDDLLAELKSESKHTSTTPQSSQQSVTTELTQSSGGSTTKVHVVQTDLSRKKSGIFDEALPWWLTDPIVSSPQVDILVQASRRALNDLLTDGIKQEELPRKIQSAVQIAANQLSSEVRFSRKDMEDAVSDLISLMMGKGPLQPLYDDPAVTDIYMDGFDSIKCVRRGQALETPFKFRSPDEYEAYITQMLQSVDRVLNLSLPIVDCVLNDKWRSRINAVHYTLLDGGQSSLVIRVPRLQQITFYDLLRTKTLPAAVAAWLAELVSCGEANIMVMGPTGSGKTTLTTALLSAVGSDERICTLEDVPEIFVPTAHLEKLVARPENSQGEGAIGVHQLLRAALRRAPHRIIVGEIRDKEGPLFLKALETGHAGSVATIHAEHPRDGLWRLLDVVQAYENAPQESLQRRIGRALNVLVSMKKIGGRPCLIDISEVRPPVGGEFVVKQIIKFEKEEGGKRFWRIMANHSFWLDHLAERGMELHAGPALLPMERMQEGIKGES